MTVAAVGADFWRIFPVRPASGRLTVEADHRIDAPGVALVSRRFRDLELGGEAALGRVLEIQGREVEVVGVLPESFDYPSGTDVWTPAEPGQKSTSRTAHNWSVVARLRDGTTPERARAELDRITAAITASADDQDPAFLAASTRVEPLRETLVGDSRRPLLLLLGAAVLVLLVACTNLASTLLARGGERARELAVRASLGADRARLVRQLLTESLLLSVLGGVAGVGLALLLIRALKALGPASVPRLDEVGLDPAVIVYAGGVAVLTALLFGLLPAIRLSDQRFSDALSSGSRGNAGRRARMWTLLVGTEVALALTLLVGSGLLIRSFQKLLGQETAFHAADVLTAGVSLSRLRYEDAEDHRRWYASFLEDAQGLPGVEVAGLASALPVQGFLPNGRLELDGDMSKHTVAGYVTASAGYFEALDIPLLQGRLFDERDGPDAPHVAIVSRSFAEENWPGEDPIGRSVSGGGMDSYWNTDPRPFGTVVGVVADVRYRELARAAGPTVYFPFTQRPSRLVWGVFLVAESATGDPASLGPVLRQAIRRADPDVPVRLRGLSEAVAGSVSERRFATLVLGGFAALALILAVVGIYGVVSYSVSRRTREMGIRMALGAEPADVRNIVVTGALRTVVGGLVVGMLGGLALTRVLEGLLYGVAAFDPPTLVAVSATLLGAALLASWLPARRTTRIDPARTMRAE